jgi:hypothetical protein
VPESWGCSWLFELPQLTSEHVQMPHQCQPLLREGTCSEISISASTWRTTTGTMHAADSFASHCRASTLLTGALGASRAAPGSMQAVYIKPIFFGRAHGVDDGSLRPRAGMPGILEYVSIDSKYIGKV